ncbi:MAG: hypothetical protein ABMB14_38090 [Myxococcota bacterium]
MFRSLMFLALVPGCGSELLAVVDGNGGLAGTYDPSSALLALDLDGASAALSTGEAVALDDGAAMLTDDLVPGDEITVFDADGAPIGDLVVVDADADLSEEDASSRYAGCGQLD